MRLAIDDEPLTMKLCHIISTQVLERKGDATTGKEKNCHQIRTRLGLLVSSVRKVSRKSAAAFGQNWQISKLVYCWLTAQKNRTFAADLPIMAGVCVKQSRSRSHQIRTHCPNKETTDLTLSTSKKTERAIKISSENPSQCRTCLQLP